MAIINGLQRTVCEWSYTAALQTANPFRDIDLDVVFTHQDGQTWTVPAFWSGGQTWRIRFAPPLLQHRRRRAAWSDG